MGYFDELQDAIDKNRQQSINLEAKEAQQRILSERDEITIALNNFNKYGMGDVDSLRKSITSRYDYDPNFTNTSLGQLNTIVGINTKVQNATNQSQNALNDYNKLPQIQKTSGFADLNTLVQNHINTLNQYGKTQVAKSLTNSLQDIQELNNLTNAVYSFDQTLETGVDESGKEFKYQGFKDFDPPSDAGYDEINKAYRLLKMGGIKDATKIREILASANPAGDKRKNTRIGDMNYIPIKPQNVYQKDSKDGKTTYFTNFGDQELQVFLSKGGDGQSLDSGFWAKEFKGTKVDPTNQVEVYYSDMEDYWNNRRNLYKPFMEKGALADELVGNKQPGNLADWSVSENEMPAAQPQILDQIEKDIINIVEWGHSQRNFWDIFNSQEVEALRLAVSDQNMGKVIELLTRNPHEGKGSEKHYRGLNKELVNALDLHDKPMGFGGSGDRRSATISYLGMLVEDWQKFSNVLGMSEEPLGNSPLQDTVEQANNSLEDANNAKNNAKNDKEKTQAHKQINKAIKVIEKIKEENDNVEIGNNGNLTIIGIQGPSQIDSTNALTQEEFEGRNPENVRDEIADAFKKEFESAAIAFQDANTKNLENSAKTLEVYMRRALKNNFIIPGTDKVATEKELKLWIENQLQEYNKNYKRPF